MPSVVYTLYAPSLPTKHQTQFVRSLAAVLVRDGADAHWNGQDTLARFGHIRPDDG